MKFLPQINPRNSAKKTPIAMPVKVVKQIRFKTWKKKKMRLILTR